MGLFSSTSKNRYGIIVDIGSGSVLVSIVESSEKDDYPNIIWSHREQAPLRKVESIMQSAKGVMAALVNACMKADSEGRIKLHEYNSAAKLQTMQVAISAPWSYTVTKTVSYKHDEPFVITENLVQELISSAQQMVNEELQENEAASNLGLGIIARTTMDLTANGYRVTDPEGELTSNIELAQATVVAQKYLVDVIEEMHSKLFPSTKLVKLSFIIMLYSTIHELMPKADDICLVDVTYEATEIGIMRDGVLRYSTHVPFGIFSLAREISEITKVPLHEAFATIRSNDYENFVASLSDTMQVELDTVLQAYIDRLSQLFHETGDTLSIPKRIVVHGDRGAGKLIDTLVQKAAKRATRMDHNVIDLASEIVTQPFQESLTANVQNMSNDTAMIVNAVFFHKEQHGLNFIYH